MPDTTPRVLYVCAWGRSGTTVLDRVLGEVPGCLSVGELRSLWDADPTVRRCGCGATVATCEVWQPVLESVLGSAGPEGTAEVRRQRDASARTRDLVARWRGARSPAPGDPADRYGRLLADLYRALLATTGASVVVDSSKHPAEAMLLAGRPDVSVSVLHLVRDPRAVAFSWGRRPAAGAPADPDDRPPPRGPWSSSSFWTLWNAVAEGPLARRLGRRSVRLRYEDVMADPRGQLGRVLELMGLDGGLPEIGADGSVHLGRSHTVAGNPNRFATGSLRLTPDRRWQREMSVRDRWLATVPALPLLGHYGYRVRPGAPDDAPL